MKFPRHELRYTADPLDTRAYKGGEGGETRNDSPEITNTDRRIAQEGSVAIGDGGAGSFIDHSTSTTYAADAQVLQTLASTMPDAVRFMTEAGADVIQRAGGAVVNLNRDSVESNRRSLDSIVTFGAGMVDKLIDASVKTTQAGTALASTAVDSFQPSENKNADSLKWGLIAAAVVAGAAFIKGAK